MATLGNFLGNSLTDLIQDSTVAGLEVDLNLELSLPSTANKTISHLPVCNCFVHQTMGTVQAQTSAENQPQLASSNTTNTSSWIAALNSGTRWTPSTSTGTPTLTYSFYLGSPTDSSYGALSTIARDFARQIFSDLSSYINLNFLEVAENGTSSSPRGNIRLQTFTGSGYAYAYYRGDVFFNASSDNASSTNGFQTGIGSHGYMSMIHEIGHSLGLKHPGNYNGSGPGTGPFLDYGDDNTGNTVMSYNFAGRSAGSLMPFDILALQSLYGARVWNTNDTTYTFANLSSFSDGSRNWGSTTSDTRLTIWDSSGIDTLNFAALASNGNGYRFDLNDGGWLSVRSEFNSTTYTARSDTSGSQYRTTNRGTRLAYGANIENLIGTSSNDEIIGNALANIINGGEGTDTLFEFGDANMTLTNTSLSREGGNTDTISSIEQANLTGGGGNNIINAAAFTGPVTLSGEAGDDNITSSNGNDRLSGGSGSDTITGGSGTDILVEVLDINMTLTNSSLTSNSVGNNDILSSIEQASLTGGSGNNTLNASAFTGPVTLSGEAGDDNLTGGNSNDRLSGGSGRDTITGGDGTDLLIETRDVSMTLSNTSLGSDIPSFTPATTSIISSGTIAVAINDNATATSSLNVSGLNTAIQDVNVRLNLTHTYVADLEVTLVSPTGTRINLFAGIGGGGDNFTNTILDDEATNAISSGAAPFTGTFKPSGLLSGFDNQNPNGDWRLEVKDNATGDRGTLTHWALEFTHAQPIVIASGEVDTLLGIEQANLTGGSSNNTLNASTFTGSVTLSGGAGADTLYGGTANDSLNGGDGADLLQGGAGNDSLVGGNDLDYLDGGMGNDTLVGGAGNDVYYVDISTDVVTESSNQGTDVVFSTAANFTLGSNIEYLGLAGTASNGTGNSLDNYIAGNDSNNTLAGSSGKDTLLGGNGSDSLDGGSDNDTLYGEVGNDTLNGGTGDDVLLGGSEQDSLIGGDGSDTLISGTGNDTLLGGNQDDVFFGEMGDDSIDGGANNDRLVGGDGNDTLIGGLGDDVLVGEAGIDSLVGGAGNDAYYVDTATDVITEMANDGTDVVFCTTDFILTANIEYLGLWGEAISGTGNALSNYIVGNASSNSLNGAAGIDSIYGAEGNDFLNGGSENDLLYGQNQNDTLFGDSGNDFLDGGAELDLLQGELGNDILIGDLGNDTLIGGADSDLLAGGAGDDQFLFGGNGMPFEHLGIDTVYDFAVGDQLALSKATFATLTSALGAGFSAASEFATVTLDDDVATSAALIVYNSTTGGLFYNQNGIATGLGNGGQFAVLTGNPTVEAGYFTILG
jgi:Ca2+-binding RTX toxin-like protein